MYEETNRFLTQEHMPHNFDALFGTNAWTAHQPRTGSGARRKPPHDLYQAQLGTIAQYVRSFEMKNRNDTTEYFLFFAGNNFTGLKKMKEAMWKADPLGTFTFSDATDPALLLLFSEPDFGVLRRSLEQNFAGTLATVGEVENHVVAGTAFCASHYKRQLAAMESDGALVATNPSPARRRGTFPDRAMVLKFR